MRVSELIGDYIYGDYGSGRIWALHDNGMSAATNRLILVSGLSIASFGVDQDNELYLCSFNGKIYTFDVQLGAELKTKKSSAITLAGNDPNPFNTTTMIRYTLGSAAHVQLVVRDLLGRVVATLVDGQQAAGEHFAAFDGAAHAPGAYYYTIADGEGREKQGRMILAK